MAPIPNIDIAMIRISADQNFKKNVCYCLRMKSWIVFSLETHVNLPNCRRALVDALKGLGLADE